MIEDSKSTLLNLLKKLQVNFSNTRFESDQETQFHCDFEIEPKDFLKFAKSDLKNNDIRGLVNALTNAKRAIDCQTDLIVTGMRIDIEKKLPQACEDFINNSGISKKDSRIHLVLLEALGVVPTRLISKVRTLRHKLEHFYEKPSKPDVDEAIELAELFLMASDSKINYIKTYSLKDDLNEYETLDGGIYVHFGSLNSTFQITGYPINEKRISITVDNKDMLFYYLMKLALNTKDEDSIQENIISLLGYIEHPIPPKNVKIASWY